VIVHIPHGSLWGMLYVYYKYVHNFLGKHKWFALPFMPILRTLFFQIKLTAQEEVALELRASQV
jgi:hypothetical protein